MATVEDAAVTIGDVAATEETPPIIGTGAGFTAVPQTTHMTLLVAHAAGASPEDQAGRRRVVVGTVEEKTLDVLDFGYEYALHTHHPLLKERNDLQRRFPAKEDFVGRKPPPVGFGGRPAETTGR